MSGNECRGYRYDNVYVIGVQMGLILLQYKGEVDEVIRPSTAGVARGSFQNL